MVLRVEAIDVLLAEERGHRREVGRRLRQAGHLGRALLRLGQRLGHAQRVARELALLLGQAAQAAQHVGGG